MQPVRCGLIAAVQDPSAVDGAVGGSGSSLITTGSGCGAGGLFRTSGSISTDSVLSAAFPVLRGPIAIAIASTLRMSGCTLLMVVYLLSRFIKRPHALRRWR